MKKLGTHNSLSYLPCQWHLRPLAWVGRCQTLNLEKQFEKGVRWFDIRVKYKGEKALSGHGLLTYDIDIDAALNTINSFKEECVIRIYLENSYFNPYKHFGRFATDVIRWQRKYPRLRFVEGGCRFKYRSVISDKADTRDCYWKKEYTLLPYPKGWAKENNGIKHIEDNDVEYSIYDFIEF